MRFFLATVSGPKVNFNKVVHVHHKTCWLPGNMYISKDSPDYINCYLSDCWPWIILYYLSILDYLQDSQYPSTKLNRDWMSGLHRLLTDVDQYRPKSRHWSEIDIGINASILIGIDRHWALIEGVLWCECTKWGDLENEQDLMSNNYQHNPTRYRAYFLIFKAVICAGIRCHSDTKVKPGTSSQIVLFTWLARLYKAIYIIYSKQSCQAVAGNGECIAIKYVSFLSINP